MPDHGDHDPAIQAITMPGMRTQSTTAEHLDGYLEGLGKLLRDKRQRASFAMYAVGLLSDGERKSMEPMATRACGTPELAHAFHERLVHFTTSAAWRDAPIRRYAAERS